MIDKRPATADEMVLAFLQAEVESPRFAQNCIKALATVGEDKGVLIDRADLRDAQQNAQRAQVLGLFRGYGNDTALFRGFPPDVRWRWVSVTPTEVANFKYAKHRVWDRLTNQTRLVADGAANLNIVQSGEDTLAHVTGVAQRLAHGHKFAAMIAVQGDGSEVILVEGNTRATAYVLRGVPTEIDMLLGSSAGIRQWAFY